MVSKASRAADRQRLQDERTARRIAIFTAPFYGDHPKFRASRPRPPARRGSGCGMTDSLDPRIKLQPLPSPPPPRHRPRPSANVARSAALKIIPAADECRRGEK